MYKPWKSDGRTFYSRPFDEKYKKSRWCWIWMAVKDKRGYGIYDKYENGKKIFRRFAHRFMWERVNGPIPQGVNVLHRCDNPSCVNPKHLFIGTHADNVADKVSKGRQQKGEQVHFAVLNEDQVRRIIALLGKQSIASLAREYGVSWHAIYAISKGKSWKHITRE